MSSAFGILRNAVVSRGAEFEPRVAAQIFDDWLASYTEQGSEQIRVLRRWESVRVFVALNRVTGVGFARPDSPAEQLEVRARLCRLLPTPKVWPQLPAVPRFVDVPDGDADRLPIEALIRWGDFGQQNEKFRPDEPGDWGTLHRWLTALKLPASNTLVVRRPDDDYAQRPLTRAECVEFLYRVLPSQGEGALDVPFDWDVD